ncbi:MAG: glycosyltransferase [Candidatus Woesearchaeota archaeon]|jgi:GT2 family glycosyltransferase
MKKNPKVSIIIPLYIDSKRFYEDLKKFKKLNYPNYEIIVVSDTVIADKKLNINDPKIRIIITGKERTGPAEKRDIAIAKAAGAICAFIDDDAYPDKDWLKNAVVHFNHPQIVAVGGPGITPKEDGYREQLTGIVYGSFFCGGHAQHRFVKKPAMFVRDYPAYNLLVKKDILLEIGGYDSHFYGGEDTFLCLKIIKKGYRILYDPEVVVYHHRRALFVPYLKQIANIGTHRGYFAKKFPETSRSLSYMSPSILTAGLISGLIFSVYFQNIRFVYFALLIGFFLIALLSVIRKTNLLNATIVALGIILTHLTYGTYFIKGLFVDELAR